MSLRRTARGRFFIVVLIAIGSGITALCAPVLAEDSPATGPTQLLPPTVTLKTDMVFHVPFSVTGDTVPVKAGTQVALKGVRDKYLKVAYGPGEATIDPDQTDFAERMQELPQPPVPELTSVAPTTPKRFLAATDSAALPRSSGKAEQRGIPWTGIFVIALFLVAGGVGAFKGEIERYFRAASQQKRRELVALGQPSCDDIEAALSDLDWFQLEKLVAALFRAKGNMVEMRGGANADGGIDLVVDSESTRAAVQCKHWSKWKCGPGVVRELIGAMKHEGFSQGFLVCRTATDAAVQLANQERITIVDREGLIERIDAAIDADNEDVRRLLFAPDKLCPKCGAQMILRTATKGSNVGSEFWGCSKYPDCRQTMRV